MICPALALVVAGLQAADRGPPLAGLSRPHSAVARDSGAPPISADAPTRPLVAPRLARTIPATSTSTPSVGLARTSSPASASTGSHAARIPATDGAERIPLEAVLTTASTTSEEGRGSQVDVGFGAQIFVRLRETRVRSAQWQRSLALTRARVSVTLRYLDVLRATIEPDFAGAACDASGVVCDDAELSDVFFDVAPIDMFDARVGQAKTPFGAIESASEWRLVSLRRGLVSDLVAERLGFGGRRLGVRGRFRARPIALKPSFELGAYSDAQNGGDLDVASRLTTRLGGGREIALQGYARANAAVRDRHGVASALSFVWDKGPVFMVTEFLLGRARVLSSTGVGERDATFLAARALAGYSIPTPLAISERVEIEIEPYGGVEGIDANKRARSDFGWAMRAGVNLYFDRKLRLSAELERRFSQSGFVAQSETTATMMSGIALE